jgi:lipopolysaccharide transport system permease protein
MKKTASMSQGNRLVSVITPDKPKIAEKGLSGFWLPDVFLTGLRNSVLLKAMVRRDIEQRYRGSFMGLLWFIAVPMFMLTAYTFVFTRVFNTKFAGAADVKQTALAIYAGMIMYGLFSEPVLRAPTLVADVPHLVKRVVFPLRIIPVSAVMTAFAGACISFALLIIFNLVLEGRMPWTAALAPLAALPVILLTLGTSWLLAAVGVFMRDIKHVTSVFMTFLMFVTPVFYPAESVPWHLRRFVYLNPLSYAIEAFRAALFEGRLPSAVHALLYLAVCLAFATCGYGVFARTQRYFADVI